MADRFLQAIFNPKPPVHHKTKKPHQSSKAEAEKSKQEFKGADKILGEVFHEVNVIGKGVGEQLTSQRKTELEKQAQVEKTAEAIVGNIVNKSTETTKKISGDVAKVVADIGKEAVVPFAVSMPFIVLAGVLGLGAVFIINKKI